MNRLSYKFLLPLICLTFALSSCQSKEEDSANKGRVALPSDAPAEVTTTTLSTRDFNHELVSNGKISAQTVAELKFLVAEPIIKIYVQNGTRVSKGQVIAKVDTYEINNRLAQAKDALDRSELEMQDILIGQGYKLDSLHSVPKDVLKLARIKSGFNSAQTQYEMAMYTLKQSTLTAPISGVVANLSAKEHTLSSPSEVFCHIIDTQSLEVEFEILENELSFIKLGDKVEITPYSLPDVKVPGKVSEINPWVNENGMIKIKTNIHPHPQLVKGMNVRVSTFQSVGKQWVVPKSAVVLRSGKQVVFTVKDSIALWNYVQTGLENATEFTITSETLKEGDEIIISGNINLAHEAPISVIKSND